MNPFKDQGFKTHITLSLYGKKIIDKKLNELIKLIDFEDEGYYLSPTIERFLFDFELSKDVLSGFNEMKVWMIDDQLFDKIVPYWDTDDNTFEYKSYKDILLLPNLISFESTNREDVIDVAPLIEHKKIKRVVLSGTMYDETKIKNGKEKQFQKLLNAGFKKNNELMGGNIEFVRK